MAVFHRCAAVAQNMAGDYLLIIEAPMKKPGHAGLCCLVDYLARRELASRRAAGRRRRGGAACWVTGAASKQSAPCTMSDCLIDSSSGHAYTACTLVSAQAAAAASTPPNFSITSFFESLMCVFMFALYQSSVRAQIHQDFLVFLKKL